MTAEVVTRQVEPTGALKWLGLVVAALVAGLGAILGLVEELPLQEVLFYAAATFALTAWLWRLYLTRTVAPATEEEGVVSGFAALRRWARRNWVLLLAIAILLLAFLIASLTLEGFFGLFNVISGLILLALLILSFTVSRFFVESRSAFIGLMVLTGLFIIGSFTIEGFFSAANIRSMLLFAAFLGLASIGQTLVALLGGLDLSIPFVIGAANIGLAYILGLGVPSWLAVIFVLLAGALIGLVNGLLSYRLQGQALILTLGTGFAVSGATQILTSIGSAFAGNVFTAVPDWLKNLAAMNGVTFGLPVPPVIAIWVALSLLLIVGMRATTWGRQLYALGGNRTSARRLSISERGYWVAVYTISGLMAAATGALLLGWSGGGFIGVGDQYLFLTLAAVVVGGTSLLGGQGGYGFTVIGVLVLQVLTSFLVGIGLNYQWQQFIFGLLILPMVALYARSPHIRTQI